jgi:hypothetical protein
MPLEAIGDDSNLICLNASRASHGVAQVAIHSQVASQGTGVIPRDWSFQCLKCGYGHVLIIYIYIYIYLQALVLHASRE